MNIFTFIKLQQVVAELLKNKVLFNILNLEDYDKVKIDSNKNNSYYHINTLVRCPVSGFSRRAFDILMSKINFNKPALTLEEQIVLLKNRVLLWVDNPDKIYEGRK